MLNYRKKLLAAAGAVVTAGTIAVTGLSAASAAPAASGTEHFQVMSTNAASNAASVIAYGVFTAAGTAYLGPGKTGKAVFPDGTITLSHKAGKGKSHFNPKTCFATITQPGTYTIVRGTGRYRGISGSGKYLLDILFVGTKNAKGKCQGPPHGSEQELLRLAGPAHL